MAITVRAEKVEDDNKKTSLLKKYIDRPVTKFRQYDCFIDSHTDDMFRPDADGDCLFSGDTDELMHGSSVRVLIRPEETRGNVVRALLKIAQWVNEDNSFKSEDDEEQIKF